MVVDHVMMEHVRKADSGFNEVENAGMGIQSAPANDPAIPWVTSFVRPRVAVPRFFEPTAQLWEARNTTEAEDLKFHGMSSADWVDGTPEGVLKVTVRENADASGNL